MSVVLFAALVVVGVTLLVVAAVRALFGGIGEPSHGTTPPQPRPGSGGAARRILEERYAAGEVDTEEYRHRLRVLQGGQ